MSVAVLSDGLVPDVEVRKMRFVQRHDVMIHYFSAISASTACPTGYTRQTAISPCVNLRIDMNNCGTYGFVCNPSTFTSCSYGTCSSAAAVLLPNAVAPSGWGGSATMDDSFLTIAVPFPIRLYGTTTSSPSMSSNGVSA